LDFLSQNDNVKRIAYAASFGVDDWEFSEEDTNVCRNLLQKFDAVSVRENSAVLLCEKYLNRADVMHVLDPTMLLDKEDYIHLVEKENEPKSLGNLFCYILDEDEKKNEIIKTIAKQTNAVPFTQMPKCRISQENLKDRLEDCVYPTVTAWLRAFMDAEMVVTDSFHGCVFSIIFNKPFIVYGNKGRGMARFHSLLSIFGLENRLITNSEDALRVINEPINWETVNVKKKEWQEKSLNFLKTNL
jgi:exopolysaccharide biosynthesis predicted pyruvyltransferase EpsI